MTKPIIQLRVRPLAEAQGVKNASHLSKLAGIPISSAYELWKGDTKRLDFSTLASLCEALQCDIGQLLSYSKPQKRNK